MSPDIESYEHQRAVSKYVSWQTLELGLGCISLGYVLVEHITNGSSVRTAGAAMAGIALFIDSIRRTSALRHELRALDAS